MNRRRVGDVADVVIFFFVNHYNQFETSSGNRTFSLSVVILRRAELKE